MKAKIIIIGNELLYGRIPDTNGPWLAKWLDNKGIELSDIQILPDDREVLLKAFREAWVQYDLIFTTGGIGPTEDDMTKGLLAEAFNKEIKPCEKAAKIVKENYKYYKREWTPEHNSYHHVPEDFIITPNPKGLAPGLVYNENSTMIMSAPGVPRELRAMVTDQFEPLIDKFFHSKLKLKERVVIRTARVPEETIFGELCPTLWSDLSKYGTVSSLPQVIGVDIIVTLKDHNYIDAFKKIKSLIEKTPLIDNVWHWSNQPLPELVVEEASKKKLTISFAESCTGGLTSSRITDIPGSSAVLLGSLVTYSNDAKSNILGVPQQIINKYGAVSEETVLEMAKGAKEKMGADLSIAFSGIAGPTGGSEEKPVGTLALGWSSSKETSSAIYNFSGDREHLKLRFSEIGLFQLLQMIRSY